MIDYIRDFKDAFHGRLGLVINEKKPVAMADEGPVADALRILLKGTELKEEERQQ